MRNTRGDSLTFKKVRLLDILRKNREKHVEIYENALEEYRKEVVNWLDYSLKLAKEGREIRHSVNLERPVNYKESYDDAIEQLNLCNETDVALSDAEFRQFVMDRWGWKDQFIHINSSYTDTSGY